MRNIFHKREISIATGLVKPKTTALFFDKIWIPELKNIIFDETIPQDFLYRPPFAPQRQEKFLTLMQNNTVRNMRTGNLNFDFHILPNAGPKFPDIFGDEKIYYDEIEFQSSHYRNKGIKEFVEEMKFFHNIDITPIYIDAISFSDDFYFDKNKSFDNTNPIAIVIDQVPQICEEHLEWKQVEEMRKDKTAIKRLHKFRNWVVTDLSKCTKDEIISIYYQTLEKYQEALKKYGITTVSGALSIVMNSAGMMLSNIGKDAYEQLSVGISITTGLSMFTIQQCQSYIQERNKPIAYIYDVLKKIDK